MACVNTAVVGQVQLGMKKRGSESSWNRFGLPISRFCRVLPRGPGYKPQQNNSASELRSGEKPLTLPRIHLKQAAIFSFIMKK